MILQGQLGLVSSLPLAGDVASGSSVLSDVAVELRPSLLVSDWQALEVGVYTATVDVDLAGLRRDVVAVRIAGDVNLQRAETPERCAASPGSYHYDPEVSPQLRVRLPGSADPRTTLVSISLGFYFAGRGLVQPALGANLLDNGSFEAWTTPVQPKAWALTGAQCIREDTARGSAAKLVGTGALSQDGTCVPGALYRLSGSYRIDSGGSGLAVQHGGAFLTSDGRSTSPGETVLALEPTGGRPRRFSLDFCAFAQVVTLDLRALDGAVAFDDIALSRIFRFEYHEPRLASTSIPSVQSGSNDVFFGGKRIGIGEVTLIDADGAVSRALAGLDVIGCELVLRTGGEDVSGRALPFEAWTQQFTGIVQQMTACDETLTFQLLDHRSRFHRKLPPRTYDTATFPRLDPRAAGKPRPLLFGAKENRTPVRVDDRAFEICDCTDAAHGIAEVSLVHAYATDEAAKDEVAAERRQLAPNVDFLADLATARIVLLRDVGPYVVVAAERTLPFDLGGPLLTATLTPGAYAAAELAAHVRTCLRATASGDMSLSCSYNESTNRFTVARTAGPLNLRPGQGSAYRLLGFTQEHTGASSYESDEPTLSDPVLRVAAKGYHDDLAGTYTGRMNGLIEIGSDICRVLVTRYLNRPAGTVDEASFLFARQRAPESLALYLAEPESTRDIFDRLEHSNAANIVVGGDGRIQYLVYVRDVPGDVVDLGDHDYLPGFRSEQGVADVHGRVVVQYDRDPTTGEWKTHEEQDPSVELRFGRGEPREFETYIKVPESAVRLAKRLLSLARQPARKVVVPVRGKLLMSQVGDKIRLTRSRALDPTGKLEAAVFRVLSIDKQPLEGLATAEAVDDVVTVANEACLSACQLVCELVSQDPCVIACQQACQLVACQAVCETVTQGCGYTVCMTTCEVACQGCGQTTCQETCQLACEGCGQTACEQACEAECQSCYQTACQDTCQLACQGCGQTSCEETCQAQCQTACESACQNACEATCQEECQSTCQSWCEVTCEQWCEQHCQETWEP